MARPRKGATRNQSQETAPVLRLRWVAILILVPLILAGLSWGFLQLTDPASFPVKTIRIETRLKQVGRDDIRRAVLDHVQQGFLRVDVDSIRHELESLPWVAHASVRRSWPDVLIVGVEEQQAVARWSNGGLLNASGDLFRPEDEKPWSSLPLLRGPKQTEQILMKEYQAMQGMLTPLGLRISHLTMNERRAWSLNLDNGLKLRLGRNDAHLRLLRFVRVYAKVLKPRQEKIDSVDLRYTNGFAVRWRDNASATV